MVDVAGKLDLTAEQKATVGVFQRALQCRAEGLPDDDWHSWKDMQWEQEQAEE